MRRPPRRPLKLGVALGLGLAFALGAPACNTVLGLGDLYVNCQPGEGRCVGPTPEACNEDGEWLRRPPCGAGKHCAGGACAGACAPGDLRCSPDTADAPQRCDASGDWQDDGPHCASCVGCDPTTGVCLVSPKINAAACDDVVLDKATGLAWQRVVPADSYLWSEAVAHCQSLDTIPSFPTGWRLPTRDELAQIVDPSHHNPSIDPSLFPDTPSEAFWSATPYAGDPTLAWYVSFVDGTVSFDEVSLPHRARCVR